MNDDSRVHGRVLTLLLLLTFSLLWFLLSLVLVWPWLWQQICCICSSCCIDSDSSFVAWQEAGNYKLQLNEPLFFGRHVWSSVTSVQRRYFSLVQWSKTANMSKTSNNNLFFNSSLTPENIHVFIKQPYLHCVQTLSIHVIRRTGKTLKGILLTTFRDSYQKKIRWFTHFDGSIV